MEEGKLRELATIICQAEKMEENFIDLFDALLDLGVENNLPREFRQELRNDLLILKEDSLVHQGVMEKLKSKYHLEN